MQIMLKNVKLVGFFSLTAYSFLIGITPPVLSQTQEYPAQVASDGSSIPTTWHLQSCTRQKSGIVRCTLSLTTNQDHSYGVSTDYRTEIIDAEGNPYYPSRAQVEDRMAESPNPLAFTMVQNASYLTTIDFTGVPTSVSQITVLQVWNGGLYGVRFLNVPIINPDGSFAVIPNSDRPSADTQLENNSTTHRLGTTRPRVCFPGAGCL